MAQNLFKSFVLLILVSANGQYQDSLAFKPRKYITPVVLGSASLVTLASQFKNFQTAQRAENYAGFETKADDYLQYAPSLAWTIHVGLKEDHRADYYIRGILAQAGALTTTHFFKKIIDIPRPYDSKALNSFPSGHTTMAFVGASVLAKDQKSPMVKILAYSTATTVGILRVANHEHWASDVLMGAAIGIGATEFTYWLYPKLKKAILKRKP